MTPKTLMSIEEFAALPDDGMLHELNAGELISMPPPKPRHGDCQATLAFALVNFARPRDLGKVYTETGYRLTPNTVRAPDVSFVRKSRLQDADQYFLGGPDLAVEIIVQSKNACDFSRGVHLDLLGARIDHPNQRRSRGEVLLDLFPKIGGIITRRYDLNGEIGPAKEILVGILQARFSDEGHIRRANGIRIEAVPGFCIDLSEVE